MMRQHSYRLCGKIVGNSLRLLAVLFFICLSSTYAQDEEYDTPILELPEDVCEVEITPEMVDMLLYDPKTLYTLVIPAPCEPPPPTQYKCKGCKDKNLTVYECYHETMDPSVPCDENRCIRNVARFKSCYVSDRGEQDCRVLFDQAGDPDHPEDNVVVQYEILLPEGVRCNAQSQNPELWFVAWVGCPYCIEIRTNIRCRTSSEVCRGRQVRVAVRRGRYFCSQQPCPKRTPVDPTDSDHRR